jgi:hypothetical protein
MADMDPELFSRIGPFAEDLAAFLEEMITLNTDEAKQVRYSLQEISSALGKGVSVTLAINVHAVTHAERRTLPLVQLALSYEDGGAPRLAVEDGSPQRYLVSNAIQVVPQSVCPVCWGRWTDKFENPSCPHCGTTLGKDCKVLLDSDQCPRCGFGEVTMQTPLCDDCGYEIDVSKVSWG